MTRRTVAQYDWTNCLFDDTRLGISSGTGIRHYTSPRRDQIRFIVAHHMTIVGDGTGKALNGCWNTWQNRKASAHYGVEENLVRQYVGDGDAAWATASTYGNHAGISIEHANSTAGPGWKVSETTWKTGARLAANLHKLYGLGRPVKNVTLRRHHDFYATACPGPFFDSIWSQYVAEAQRVYDSITGVVQDSAPVVQDPVPTPTPTPTPTVKVISVSQNFAGNNARGIATASTRIPRYVAARKASPVHVINAQECTVTSTVRSRLDSGLTPLGYKRRDGGKGRYTYTRNVNVIAHGLITTPSSSWYQRDDKQAAWVIYEHGGAIGMDVSLHLESDAGSTADAKRVAQAKYIASKALTIAAANGCPAKNVLITGDTNSEGLVVAALSALGWRNCAAGTPFVNTHTFMGWDGLSRKRFDYALVRHDAAPAELVSVSHDTGISDHAGLRVVRQLTK